MSEQSVRETVLTVLSRIAPEMEPDAIDPSVSLRDQLDIDSMDFLNFVIGLHKALGVDIPEVDYPRLVTIDGCVEYLSRALVG